MNAARLGAVLLAAGASHRYGAANKLLQNIDGEPLVRRSAETLLGVGFARVAAVLGDEAPQVRAALDGLEGLDLIENANHAAGMGTSLAAGVRHLQEDESIEGAMIALGDMPYLRRSTLVALTAAFAPDAGAAIVLPIREGRRGHPVLFARRYFDALAGLAGDVGARQVIAQDTDAVREVATDDPGIHLDIDTPGDLARRG